MGATLLSMGMFTLSVVPAFAHVIVYPHQVGIAATQDFTVNVPNERDNPATAVKLMIPDGVTSVVPNAIPGWTINTKQNGSGDNATVSEIDWTDGSIPVGQRAEFIFQAQVPAKPTTLAWKAYQTYSDGTIVSWDVNPDTLKNLSDAQQDALADKQNKGEYSTTQVINDLTGNTTQQPMNNSADKTTRLFAEAALGIAVVAFAVSVAGLKKKK